MKDKPDGGPAFPCVSESKPEDRGLSLRDYFAGQAIAGMLASESEADRSYKPHQLADRAYDVADAMLAERQKEVEP